MASSTVKEKIGGQDTPVGHKVRVKVTKNKVGPPFRKAEFMVYYDGRKVDTTDEIADMIIANGLIPKYDSKGNISETGRTYKFELDGEELRVTKKDDIAPALKECPKIFNHFCELIKSGNFGDNQYTQEQTDAEMTEEEFEAQMEEDLKNLEHSDNPAEEVENPEEWDKI